jgi:hypothetical protein
LPRTGRRRWVVTTGVETTLAEIHRALLGPTAASATNEHQAQTANRVAAWADEPLRGFLCDVWGSPGRRNPAAAEMLVGQVQTEQDSGGGDGGPDSLTGPGHVRDEQRQTGLAQHTVDGGDDAGPVNISPPTPI